MHSEKEQGNQPLWENSDVELPDINIKLMRWKI